MDEQEVTRARMAREWYDRWRDLKWLTIAAKNLLLFLGALGLALRMIWDTGAWLWAFLVPPK